ncbi:MAG: hypothetical protein C3F02_04555 [Parcubacteria group bacterium]|nr:MAG: hypothetical protein C3F02_04555 [Parcubacteria group bacterium]
MKKMIFLFSVLLAAVFIFPSGSRAQVTITDGPDAIQIRNLYAGNIVVLDDGYKKDYYYIEPLTQEKYYFSDDVSLLKLIRALGQSTNTKSLVNLPQSKSDKNANYNAVQKLRGRFLLQTDNDNQAWYINPLDNLRYKIDGGKDGLKIVRNLALNVDSTKLSVFPLPKKTSFRKNTGDAVDFGMFWQVQNLLKKNYYQPDKVNDSELFYGALQGVAASLQDPYTVFFTPPGSKNFLDNISGATEGIGAYVDVINGRLTIIAPLENSPALAAGLLPNDQVLTVDDVDISGWLLDNAVGLIKGQSGTAVKLKIYRPASDRTFDVSIVRAKIVIPTIEAKTLNNNLAYIKISSFSQDLPTLFNQARNKVIGNATRGVIIDLRNNPGGYTDAAQILAESWLPEGDVIFRENYSDHSQTYQAISNNDINLPTVILINSGSASAAEIFTLALSKNGLAQTVGETSFGKGTGQQLANFPDGSALKYTVFEWFGPQDSFIEGQGIKPDYAVQNTPGSDLQLEKALTLLR